MPSKCDMSGVGHGNTTEDLLKALGEAKLDMGRRMVEVL